MPRVDFLCLFTLLECIFTNSAPIVNIPNQGSIAGVDIANMRVHKIFGYYGIPYAHPPLELFRFAPPVTDTLPNWEGVRNFTDYAPSCLQSSDFKKEDIPFLDLFKNVKIETNEDCLYLNVFVPVGSTPPNGYAVIVWIHPGNFTSGTPAIWNPHTLVHRQKVIVVTFSYRLNIMGFFTTMDGEAPGNFGLMDQQAALKWVKNNIALFNGDPNSITLMGSGAGGISTAIHMINPESREYFHKAIIMSADFINPSIIKLPTEDKKALDTLASKFFCNRKPTSKLMECLRNADSKLLIGETSHNYWRPILDATLSNNTNPFLTDLPRTFFESGQFAQIPVLTGYTQMEQILNYESILPQSENVTTDSFQKILSKIINDDLSLNNNNNSEIESCEYNTDHILDTVNFFYTPPEPITTVESLRKLVTDFTTDKSYGAATYQQALFFSNEPTYVYRFDIRPSSKQFTDHIPEWVTVPHLFDLIYVWGVPYWRHDLEYDVRDKRISDAIMSFWTNFAKQSEPTKNSIYPIKWSQFTPNTPGILLIDGSFNMSNPSNLNYKAFDFWNIFYPKVTVIGTQCCATEDGTLLLPTNFLVLLSLIIASLSTLY